ncbi:MAG: cation:proton antiporter [Myxococcales bacterium]|jgi:Kef-type K+ transport system membrane component KefB
MAKTPLRSRYEPPSQRQKAAVNLAPIDIFHVLAAISALLVFAHLGASLAARIGIPPMVGELTGGILLGATVFRRIWPEGHAWLLPVAPSPVAPILGFCSTIGLLMLLYIGGLQLRRLITARDTRAVGWISALGVLIPVGAGLLVLQVVDVSKYLGSANQLTALKIVLLIELAITSIPVITRIFLDLGLMSSRLARIVLSVAVIEDVMLYIALSIALGMAQAGAKSDASIPHYLGFAPDSAAFIAWHIVASLALLAVAAWGFGKAVRPSSRLNPIAERSPLGWTLVSILVITGAAMFLGLAPMFGALVAGMIASTDNRPPLVKARQQVEAVGSSFFIPLYFALIGTSLDLIRDFDWRLTVGLLILGSAVKYGGALLGARAAGERPAMAHAISISVNARGGPGLVVASTAFAAGITNPAAYTSLIILAIVSSVLAAIFLARALRRSAAAAELIGGEEGEASEAGLAVDGSAGRG